ncbi:Planctomycete cytochrome C [Planctomycetes bacterium MalM25]|nr:Planctomycete cytochrome C [Planctomycetes bacterium MalM25]
MTIDSALPGTYSHRSAQRQTLVRLVVAFIVLGASSLAVAKPNPDAEGEVRFNRDIRPLLSDRCFACHGPDAENAASGLRLDVAEEALDYGAIAPGEPDESEMIARIESDDHDLVMPPEELHKPLTDEEKALLRRWVAQGAEYEPHWAYTPMRAKPEELTKNLVDHFVEAKLRSEGITPVGAADRVTLIRRLSLDLTGIPPTVEEVESFVSDVSPDAYGRLVDRLLDSPRYGERMASYWLDLVRYADTVGYHGDQEISQWAYRDYVIDSFNENLPYDQFVREQLAGDLLPEATDRQLIASGYNRMNQTTEEGGAQAKEYLAIYFADRVRNTSQVFLGSTLGCAQCHDHKYDPFTIKDFYSFGAFFADLEERGVYYGRGNRPPVLSLPSEDQRRRIEELKPRIASKEAARQKLRDELLAGLDSWRPDEGDEFAWVEDAKAEGRRYHGEWWFVDASSNDPVYSGARSRRQESDRLVQHFFTHAEDAITLSAKTQFFAWVYLDPKNPPDAIMVQFHDGKDWSHRVVWGGDQIVYGRDKESWAGYRRKGALPEAGKWVRLEIDPAEIGLKTGGEGEEPSVVSGMAFTQHGGLAWWDRAGWSQNAPAEVLAAHQTPAEERTEEQAKALTDYFLRTSAEMTEFDQQLENLRAELKEVEASVPTTVVSRSVKPRAIRILPRGNWMDDSGDVVQPAVPEFLGDLDTGDRRATRLDLANWIGSEENPLTARTMANRLWAVLFGRGVCSSIDDFGGQGTYPSDPDLLDALAVEFVESGWDVKHLLRTIANSEAYRRSSRPTPELRENDPYNDAFARQGRFRVDAEVVRDAALAASGLLVERVGGPSVHPYQPAGYYAQLNFPKRTYQSDKGESQYRRALYTHWQRTFLHPMLKAFDAPSREECTAQRARSSTPLQALTLLNDPTFVEAARVFAERILREGGASLRERIVWAYRSVVSHEPEAEIVDALAEVYENHLDEYRANPTAAKQLLSTGLSPAATDLDRAELAAWTGVARTIMNLHETTTRY